MTKGADTWIEANIRSIRADEKFRSTSTLKSYITQSGALTIDIPYLKEGAPVCAAFRLLGYNTREEIEALVFDPGNLVGGQSPEEEDAARRLLAHTFQHPLFTCDEGELVRAMGEPLATAAAASAEVTQSIVTTEVRLARMVNQQISGELLPHCGYDDSKATKERKAIFLGMMVRRMLFIHLKFEEPDDRDFEGETVH